MTNQTDDLMDLEIDGRVRTMFGILDSRRLDENNGSPRYHGEIELLDSIYKVPECIPGNRFDRSDLVRALEEARKNNKGISGIINMGENSGGYWCESHEGWDSHWQP